MPLNAVGWSTEEDEKLAELVKPHTFLYNIQDPSRKNILARESTWQEIAHVLSKPVEECKKRWRGLRDGYMRSKRVGTLHISKADLFEKLRFLDGINMEFKEDPLEEVVISESDQQIEEDIIVSSEQQVITDNTEYCEFTVVESPRGSESTEYIKVLPKMETMQQKPKRNKRNGGRKKSIPLPRNITPIKILPKPIMMNGPKIVRYVEDQQSMPEHRSQVIDKLIERALRESSSEIDVFFRSMAASVKKLQPNLIPKVKMEVCNVIAKYEMQSFERNQHH